jgi:hypothetical protein
MREIKIQIKATENIGTKLACVKHIKEMSGFGLKQSKDILDDILDNVNTWRTIKVSKGFYDSKKLFKDNYGIEMKGYFNEKLSAILDGEIVMKDTIEKYESFIESINEIDAVGLDIFKNLLPLLSDYPFELKNTLRDLARESEEAKREREEENSEL